MDLLHRIDPISGIYLNSSYQVGSPYIQPSWIMVAEPLPSPNIFNVVKWNFDTLQWVEGMTQQEIDQMAMEQALDSETINYEKRQCDGVKTYARISAEFRLAKLSGSITEEVHGIIEDILIPVRNEVLSGQWMSAKQKLESIGNSVIGVDLYNRLHLQISEYIDSNYTNIF